MANAPGRRLKVFQAQFGFHDSVVAATSQAAALRAWGTRQNLFAEGQATVTDDPQAVEAARDHPGIPLRRAVGSNAPFALEPTGLPHLPDAPRRPRQKSEAPPPPAPERAPADRARLTAAETALQKIDAARKRQEAAMRRREEALERQAADGQAAYVAARKAATAAVVTERQAYRAAGGED
jgi:type IV secretory pathway VirB10-like protein